MAMTRSNTARITNWSKHANHAAQPRNPLDGYMGGNPNRAERRAMARLAKRNKGVDDGR